MEIFEAKLTEITPIDGIKSYRKTAEKYADDVISGKINAGAEIVAACERFKSDLGREDLELRTHDPDVVINIIEKTMVHAQGEDIDGSPLLGKPFLLQPWQIFIVYNLLGFWYRGTNNRRYKMEIFEAKLTEITPFEDNPRKNGPAVSKMRENIL